MNWCICQKKLLCLETGIFYQVEDSAIIGEWSIVCCGSSGKARIAVFKSRQEAAYELQVLAKLVGVTAEVGFGGETKQYRDQRGVNGIVEGATR